MESSDVGAGDAGASPRKFFRQILLNLANLGEIWAKVIKI